MSGQATAMPNYRHNLLLGGTYCFTANPADRRLKLLTENIDLLRAAFRRARTRHPFAIDAAVILPDHLQMIWTLPADDADFALRWRPSSRSWTPRRNSSP